MLTSLLIYFTVHPLLLFLNSTSQTIMKPIAALPRHTAQLRGVTARGLGFHAAQCGGQPWAIAQLPSFTSSSMPTRNNYEDCTQPGEGDA